MTGEVKSIQVKVFDSEKVLLATKELGDSAHGVPGAAFISVVATLDDGSLTQGPLIPVFSGS